MFTKDTCNSLRRNLPRNSVVFLTQTPWRLLWTAPFQKLFEHTFLKPSSEKQNVCPKQTWPKKLVWKLFSKRSLADKIFFPHDDCKAIYISNNFIASNKVNTTIFFNVFTDNDLIDDDEVYTLVILLDGSKLFVLQNTKLTFFKVK